ncbi:head maturation protease, ClpP-related [Gracilibacillus dipsosauri]|uniref:head maturation protease, ClpP-related n=1 Tax=Gracilibacillus dipsosauri TaxID=178340 RepID=UPI0024095952
MKHKIKGDIISWNSSIWDFNQRMKSIKEDEDITLEINSYGGDVFLGIDIMNTLRSHQGEVTVIVTGIAASAASIIAMGADVIKMYSNTQLMIHNAWTIVAGDAKKLRKKADDLDSVGESVLASYTHRVDEDTVKKLLDEEKYMSAKVAKEFGFIDEIVDAVAEEVESEIFQDKANEFNNTITKDGDDELKDKIVSLEEEVSKLKQKLKEQKEEPEQPLVAKRKGFFF